MGIILRHDKQVSRRKQYVLIGERHIGPIKPTKDGSIKREIHTKKKEAYDWRLGVRNRGPDLEKLI